MNLVDLAGAVAILLFAQLVVVTLFAIFVIFRIMGKNYDAAVIAGGSFGLFLGIIVPLVGAFFIDISNAVIIQSLEKVLEIYSKPTKGEIAIAYADE